MIKIIINFFQFFVVLSVMFLVFSFLSHVLVRKVSLNKIFSLLESKIFGLSNVLSALIGAVTPFCVCTTIPVFTSMLEMGVKPNTAMSFLFSSPLISVSAAALIVFLFGVKFSLYYITAALVFSILGGLFVRLFKLEGEMIDKFKETNASFGQSSSNICKTASKASFRLFKDLLIPLLIGALIAGVIHNYVPVKAIEVINKYPLWMTIPLAALIGFPIYSNIMVLAPICFSLLNKGMNQGAIVAFMMSGAGISFPTAIVLKGILKNRLFIYYLVYTFISYCIIGFVFNLLK